MQPPLAIPATCYLSRSCESKTKSTFCNNIKWENTTSSKIENPQDHGFQIISLAKDWASVCSSVSTAVIHLLSNTSSGPNYRCKSRTTCTALPTWSQSVLPSSVCTEASDLYVSFSQGQWNALGSALLPGGKVATYTKICYGCHCYSDWKYACSITTTTCLILCKLTNTWNCLLLAQAICSDNLLLSLLPTASGIWNKKVTYHLLPDPYK